MSPSSLTTVEHAFEIIEVLWELDGAGPTAIAERLDIPDSTAYEYLRALSNTRFVNRSHGTYALSSYFLTMGGKMRHRSQLFQVAKGEMRRAADATDELIGLTIEDGGWGIIFHQEEGDRALNLGTYVGAATPLHTNASGKVILAFLPESQLDDLLPTLRLVPRTEFTITDIAELRDELEEIREDGFAVDWDEQVVGMGMVAVPVIIEDEVMGSICVVAPTGRIKHRSYQKELVRTLQEIKQTIAIHYQYGQ